MPLKPCDQGQHALFWSFQRGSKSSKPLVPRFRTGVSGTSLLSTPLGQFADGSVLAGEDLLDALSGRAPQGNVCQDTLSSRWTFLTRGSPGHGLHGSGPGITAIRMTCLPLLPSLARIRFLYLPLAWRGYNTLNSKSHTQLDLPCRRVSCPRSARPCS